LAQGKGAAQALALMDSAHRLAQPDRMGALFKALAICHPALPTPPGFEP
jgi:SAM-dependent MidA family methyltransferase